MRGERRGAAADRGGGPDVAAINEGELLAVGTERGQARADDGRGGGRGELRAGEGRGGDEEAERGEGAEGEGQGSVAHGKGD